MIQRCFGPPTIAMTLAGLALSALGACAPAGPSVGPGERHDAASESPPQEFRSSAGVLRVGPFQAERQLRPEEGEAALLCYEATARGTEGPGGAIHLRLVWRGGRFQVVTATERVVLSNPFRDCLEDVVERWEIRPARPLSEDEVIPLEFAPAPAP